MQRGDKVVAETGNLAHVGTVTRVIGRTVYIDIGTWAKPRIIIRDAEGVRKEVV